MYVLNSCGPVVVSVDVCFEYMCGPVIVGVDVCFEYMWSRCG
jgi:hypothetical protein